MYNTPYIIQTLLNYKNKTMSAINFLPRKITETHRKAIQKREAYELKLKNKVAQIPPENDKRIRDLITQFAFAIRFANFAIESLKKLNIFPRDTAIHQQLKVFTDLENYFIKSESKVNPDWQSEFNNFEDFIWDFTNHTPENKDKIIKFSRSLWNKKY